MVLLAVTSNDAIKLLMGQHPGRFSAELGIDLASGRDHEDFRWFLASVLFGARISETIVKKTFREFASRNVVSPKAILDTGWDGLVEILDKGGYVRYDFKTATKLLDLCRTLTENYHADLEKLHSAAADPDDLERRLKSLAKGIGDVTVNIFLREMRGIWEKADPLPSDLAVMAAKDYGIIPGAVKDGRKALELLLKAWKEAGDRKKDFPDFEAALVRAGIEIRRGKRCGSLKKNEICCSLQMPSRTDPIIEQLKEGDLRHKGRSEEVAAEVLRRPDLFESVVQGMLHGDPGVRMRASDAAEKITRTRPDLLRPYKKPLLTQVARSDQQEVRWHLAQILPRLDLSRSDRKRAVAILLSYLDDKSSIVRTFAMQGLADIALSDASYLAPVTKLIEEQTAAGTPAMKSRGRKLLALLQKK
jgi:hypothetical protein